MFPRSADKSWVKQHFSMHPDEDTVELYALDRLEGQREQMVEQHVFVCHQCQRKVVRFAREAQSIRAALSLYHHLQQDTQITNAFYLKSIPSNLKNQSL